jgi:hypothetical protein
MSANHLVPSGVFGHLSGEKKNCPAASKGKIVFTTIPFVARTSDVTTTIVNATLDFDASAREGMSKVKAVTF